ncbi:MAG TPA: hypothetical protein VFY93_17545 [Planctomycetota bacterium]|nr:hypothetical protein [Planctomycetota bacterium]
MWRIVRRVLIVALALVASGAGGWWLYGGRARERFEARVAALRAAGQPTRFEDFETPPIPDNENGAKLLEEAARVLDEIEKAHRNADGLLLNDEHNDADRLEIAAYLDALAPYFKLLEQIPQRPGWRPDVDWSKGFEVMSCPIAEVHDADRLLAARAEFDLEPEGRTERTAATAVLIMDLGQRCGGRGMIGHLVPWTITWHAVEVLRKATREPGFDAAAFRRIVDPKLAAVIPDRGPPASMFVDERVYVVALLGIIDSGNVSKEFRGLFEDRFGSPFLYRPGLYKSAATWLDLAEEAIRRAGTSPEDAIEVGASFHSRYPRSTGGYDLVNGEGAMYGRVFSKYAQYAASLRLARVVMALLEHRQTKGAWPESLADIGEMPTDPYSGKPFLYERTEHGCKVRSAREDTEENLESDNLLWTLDDDQIPAMPR